MGATKKAAFSAEQNRTAALAKALAHPARIAILQHLMRSKSCICGDLVDVLPLSQSTVSQHLKELKDAGLLYGNVEPPKVCYCINPAVWKEAKLTLGKLLEGFDESCGCG